MISDASEKVSSSSDGDSCEFVFFPGIWPNPPQKRFITSRLYYFLLSDTKLLHDRLTDIKPSNSVSQTGCTPQWGRMRCNRPVDVLGGPALNHKSSPQI